jgi:hydrogenase maturation protease
MMLSLSPGERLLIYGIGNPGRQDDGLGVRFVEHLEGMGPAPHVTLEANYQLTPEDALQLVEHDVVLFVDATVAPDAPGPYTIAQVLPASEISFSTHALSMGSLLALCQRLYGRAPRAFALALPGYAFEVNAELSPLASEHLQQAIDDVWPACVGVGPARIAR